MSLQSAFPFVFHYLPQKPVVGEVSNEALSSDCGFGLPLMYETCEKLGIWYTFGLAMNESLKVASDDLLAEAELQFKETGEKARLFMSMDYKAENGHIRERCQSRRKLMPVARTVVLW